MSKNKKPTPYLQPVTGPVNLKKISPRGDLEIDRKDGEERAKEDLKKLEDLGYLMFAENRRSLLIVLQGIDASGKNGTTKHLAKGINPDGLQVHSFGVPSKLELDHDYLWRVHQVAPRRGNVAIFNRSHYEEVIVTKVEPKILEYQNLPLETLNDPDLFEKRYRQINDFERMLAENGTTIVKLLLHISRDEQMERFRDRLEDPSKQWKFNEEDLNKRKDWEGYMRTFEEVIAETSTAWAPWYVVPADRKWYRNLMVSDLVTRTLEGLPMEFPEHPTPEATLREMK